MWVGANDEIYAAINQPTGKFALLVSDFLAGNRYLGKTMLLRIAALLPLCS
jgi:hypothetical protein